MSPDESTIPTTPTFKRWAPIVVVLAAMVAIGAMLADLTFDSADDAQDNTEMPAAG